MDVYKKTMTTLAFANSEDHLARKKLMDLLSNEKLAIQKIIDEIAASL